MVEPVMVVADRLRQSLEWMAEYINRLHATVDRLTGELADARSEIARHHLDFQRWEAGWALSAERADLLREALFGPVPDDWEQRATEAVR